MAGAAGGGWPEQPGGSGGTFAAIGYLEHIFEHRLVAHPAFLDTICNENTKTGVTRFLCKLKG